MLFKENTLDLIILGGGANGLATALAAQAAGYRCVVLEKNTIGSGTSSKSSKILHGGVRYLAQGNLKLVYEALHERQRFIDEYPELCHKLDFVAPSYSWFSQFFYFAGLTFYNLLAGRRSLGRTRWLSRNAAIARVPSLNALGLKAAVLYTDGQFADAELARAMAAKATRNGAVIHEHCAAIAAKYEADLWQITTQSTTQDIKQFAAPVVIDATGVWSDETRKTLFASSHPAQPDAIKQHVQISQGTHILVDAGVLNSVAAIFQSKTRDGRVLFILPYLGQTLIGTTDTAQPAPVLDAPTHTEAEIDFLIDEANRILAKPISRSDIRRIFTGYRPLVNPNSANSSSGGTAKTSREHAIFQDLPQFFTVLGGKWTTCHRIGEDVIKTIAKSMPHLRGQSGNK